MSERILADIKPPLGELSHHGVKGMHWGVRKAYTDRIRSNASVAAKVGRGEGSTLEKLKVHSQSSLVDVARNKGFKGAATRRSEMLTQHADRLDKGEAKVGDLFALSQNLRLSDLVNAKITRS